MKWVLDHPYLAMFILVAPNLILVATARWSSPKEKPACEAITRDNKLTVGLLLLIAGVIGLTFGGFNLMHYYELRKWRSAEATVTGVRTVLEKASPARSLRLIWVAYVEYKFSVGGYEYAATVEVSRGDDIRNLGLSRFGYGSKHAILYDPNAPSKFTFRIPSPRDFAGMWVLAGGGLIMLVAGVVVYRIGKAKARAAE